ncbi:cyclic AMP-dependent transcription factor ATF-2-like [Branchiostoma floridae]|uniref:Cyclic AMP-dependent transcription factor ATF-2-like n=1 Tax=Branchiostoma floridae TaxID=7739 RepID=A0A9J7KYF7_BRAFL|nr:cyclic AMP-dependent transcription factor ATF-2-like [Branchiostoma floridae]
MEDSTSDLLEDCKNLNTSELPPLVLIDGEMLNWDMSKAQLVQTSQEDIESPSTSHKEEPKELKQCSQTEKQSDVQVVVPNFEMLNKPPDSRVQRQVSKEDEERTRIRREKNRAAAERCRQKSKDRAEGLRKKTLHLENSNSGLRAEIGRLKLELRTLRAEVARHMTLCHSGEIIAQEWQDFMRKLETSNDP